MALKQKDYGMQQCKAHIADEDTRLEWIGMDWNGLEWIGMDWNGLASILMFSPELPPTP